MNKKEIFEILSFNSKYNFLGCIKHSHVKGLRRNRAKSRSLNKKGVSPVVATVLLIAIVIVLGIIIFLWARGFVSEQAVKNDRVVGESCRDIDFDADLFNCPGTCNLDIVNRGNIPLYGFDVKIRSTGEVLVHEISTTTIGIGGSTSLALGNTYGITINQGDELNIVPIILGETDSGKVAHTCSDDQGFALRVL
jgi:flagellin-like protein